jgi:hypothetical protein
VSERLRVVPTLTFQEDVGRFEEHIVQRELASNAPDDTCLFRYENDYR